MTSPIILVLGAGSNIGSQLVQKFTKNGFKVAIVSRTVTEQLERTANLAIKADFSDPLSIQAVFDEVKTKLGVPNIVVYNAFSATFTPSDPVSIPVYDFATSLTVNIASAYAAAQAAIAGFGDLPPQVAKSFIYTGNNLNVKTLPVLFNLGVGKAAAAHMIQVLAQVYNKKGYNFYYGDERKADGSAVGGAVSGRNHAEFYLELATRKSQGPWDATFVGGEGYINFEDL